MLIMLNSLLYIKKNNVEVFQCKKLMKICNEYMKNKKEILLSQVNCKKAFKSRKYTE